MGRLWLSLFLLLASAWSCSLPDETESTVVEDPSNQLYEELPPTIGSPLNGQAGFCTTTNRCSAGQGDCNTTPQCQTGLTCVNDIGANFGFAPSVDVCVAAHCGNGIPDADEEDSDCGGDDCGLCPVCPSVAQNGTGDFCSLTCRCEAGEGDCDSNAQCSVGLVCGADVGLFYGQMRTTDVCVLAHCANNVLDIGETQIDCGGNDCGPCIEHSSVLGANSFCTAAEPCTEGQGDCDSDNQCVPGSICVDDLGPEYGLSAGTDVCVSTGTPTCSDGLQNQNETNIDCGGPCAACGTVPSLTGLVLSSGTLFPTLAPTTQGYWVTTSFFAENLTLTPSVSPSNAIIRINGTVVANNTPFVAPLSVATNVITIELTSPTNSTSRSYNLNVSRGINPIPTAYGKASNPGADDRFGTSVAVSGNTIAVGAYQEDSNAMGIGGIQTNNSSSSSGAVYVYTKNGNTWTQQAYIKGHNTAAGDQFGISVALDGDTLVVGARREDSSATGIDGVNNNLAVDSGAVYVFTRTGTTWSQQAYIKPSNTGAGDYFGAQVALSGDSIAVGAYGEASAATGIDGDQNDNSAGTAGAAYIFTRSGSTWSQQAYIKGSNNAAQDRFGSSVAISEDTLAVGAWLEDSNATGVNGNENNDLAAQSGAVYVFVRSGNTWMQEAYVKASNTAANDRFGFAVAVSGDNLAVGATLEDSNARGINGIQSNNSALSSGAVYMYRRSAGSWSQQAYLKSPNSDAADEFGSSLAMVGDLLAVGAYKESSNGIASDNSAPESGMVYLLKRTSNTWSFSSYSKATNINAGDHFGISVALSATMLAVGADNEASNTTGVGGNGGNNSLSGSGAFYAFE